MSTAILHAGSFIHDFNDIVMKVSSENVQKYWSSPKNRETHDKKDKNFKKSTCFASIIFLLPCYKEVNSIYKHNSTI